MGEYLTDFKLDSQYPFLALLSAYNVMIIFYLI